MQNPDTYKGFVYQKKCAFLLLLRELADETDVKAFRMEHPKGDDFDFEYQNRIRIYQTKDVEKPNMPEFLSKMWRRYTENMRPGEQRDINLGFIFSKNHEDDECFLNLTKHIMCPKLIDIKDKKDEKGNSIVKVSDTTEWRQFLEPITVEVMPDSQVETELNRAINYMFMHYGLPKSDRKSIYYDFLGRLDEIMVSGNPVPVKEVREIIGTWFIRYSLQHPLVREVLSADLTKRCSEFSRYTSPQSPIAEAGTLS